MLNDAVQSRWIGCSTRVWVVLVMVHFAIRWHVAELLPGRGAETLVETIVVRWITSYGPPPTCVVNGDTGLNGDASALLEPPQHLDDAPQALLIIATTSFGNSSIDLVHNRLTNEVVLLPFRAPITARPSSAIVGQLVADAN